jgi:hypothetical protein
MKFSANQAFLHVLACTADFSDCARRTRRLSDFVSSAIQRFSEAGAPLSAAGRWEALRIAAAIYVALGAAMRQRRSVCFAVV